MAAYSNELRNRCLARSNGLIQLGVVNSLGAEPRQVLGER